MSEKEIAMEILVKLIESKCLGYDGFPDAKGFVDLTCEAYKKILKTVLEG